MSFAWHSQYPLSAQKPYFIKDHFQGGRPVADIKLRDHEEALGEARRAALEIMVDEVLEGIDSTRWVVRVYNDTDQLIGTIFFVDLLKSAPDSKPPHS
ncbi:hypothetical protein [Phyllobacterium sp. 628]|uniref:DUF6894 family protein n=1 Tax=Phyllobacterium sp. 628 TaxID=2718938 RepID=UPI0035304BF9